MHVDLMHVRGRSTIGSTNRRIADCICTNALDADAGPALHERGVCCMFQACSKSFYLLAEVQKCRLADGFLPNRQAQDGGRNRVAVQDGQDIRRVPCLAPKNGLLP